ncbi:phenylalanine--tRNA ligase subunit beta [Desulfohalovibrio reitneri]|uniref:phenylalanine--tRNA ligase subunit beta n=1 Tax=Desulfohalovibrio reitneri TaxID=1307759 RepID=UPI0004A73E75|nr:phenylalanine--tRNA ligase subunit beta [Desulfohalovibrio reitneri]
MRVSLQWLREMTPFDGTPERLADQLTMLGLEVDEIARPFAGLEGVVIGHVVECGPHPDADKLSVTRVDVGDETLDIVCGAPNVAKGQTVAVAKVGTTLPDGLKIKKAKIRGQASHGMICSERELSLGEGHEGILALEGDFTPGQRFMDALGLDDTVLDIDLTPNRADCLSHLGVAREAALAFGLPLTPPLSFPEEISEAADADWRIDIDDPELCPLYMARVIRGVSVGPSPLWLRKRLLAVGQRPVNNVVDVTNYVLLEMGHPLHAFDEDLLRGGVVRVAPSGEPRDFTTLDGQIRRLEPDDLLIWDNERPVALAGVMGGADTEMHGRSANVLLECAVFKPASIRRTARRQALPSEASHRFERGVDQAGARKACDRAAQLIQATAGGRVLSGVARSEPKPWQAPTLGFRPARASEVVGIEFDHGFCRDTLRGLGCEVSGDESAEWSVVPPSHRLDLEREIDLVEEVARVYGMDNIPTTLPRVRKSLEDAAKPESEYDFELRLKRWARGAGLRECINYAFLSHRELDLLGLPSDNRVDVANPLSEEQGAMRTAVCSGLVRNLGHNLAHGQADLRLFELAKAFFADPDSETTVREEPRLAVLLHGRAHPGGFPYGDEPVGYADLKGIVEDLARYLNLPSLCFTLEEDHPFMEPAVQVSLAGRPLGALGRLRADPAAEAKARTDAWLAELDATALRELDRSDTRHFQQLPVYPASWRDVTLVVPDGVQAGGIEEAMRGANHPLMESVRMVNAYRPEGAAERNLSFRLTYRSPKKTLKDAEVDKAHDAVIKAVLNALPVKAQE